jgi:hypothetical protein
MRLKAMVRLKAMACAGLAALGVAMAVEPAAAFDWDRVAPPAGWGTDRTVRHWVYYPRYHNLYHVHGGTDPYAYRRARRGYYPYGSSAYWRAPQHLRPSVHGAPPKYYPSWGTGPSQQHRALPWHW